ncbi:MAG: hypothetical protein HY069_00250 [Chlamydiia bacterium]|nr:hypothetical protein [Chlamydiia bacterium]
MKFLLLFAHILYATPQYYCTGANFAYYESLLNLIGSIHDTNFEDCEEIAVFDLGLTQEQLQHLKTIQKVSVYTLEKTHPDILSYYRGHGIVVFGWYAWKPVAIHLALQRFPYVLWLDAGTEVRNRLDFVFEYIQSRGYLLCTIGDEKDAMGHWLHPVGWGTTQFVKEQLGLDTPQHKWILDCESVMGGFIGVSRTGASYFLNDLYAWTFDLRYYADDGSAPNGWGCARHDQTLLSYLAYSRQLQVHRQNGIEGTPIWLSWDQKTSPFYITYSKHHLGPHTHIFNCRTDKTNHAYYFSKIRYRP